MEEAVAWVREAAEANGGWLTQAAYEAWRKEQRANVRRPRPLTRYALSLAGVSWPVLLREAKVSGKPCVDPKPNYVEHLKGAAAEHAGRLSAAGYARFASSRPDVPGLKRIKKAFGSFPGALKAAQIAPWSARRRPNTDLLDALRKAARETGAARGQGMTMAQYDAWRMAHAPGAPSLSLLVQRLGTWRQAQVAAGLLCASAVALSGPGRNARPKEELLDALRKAARETGAARGQGMTMARYDAWRTTCVPGAPSLSLLVKKLETWRKAQVAAGLLYPSDGEMTRDIVAGLPGAGVRGGHKA